MRYKNYTRALFRKEVIHHKAILSRLLKEHNKLMRSEGVLRFLDSFEKRGLSRFSADLREQQEKLQKLHHLLMDPLDESIIDSIRQNMYISTLSLIQLYTDIFNNMGHIITEIMEEHLENL